VCPGLGVALFYGLCSPDFRRGPGFLRKGSAQGSKTVKVHGLPQTLHPVTREVLCTSGG
jgi:hypothetical protein